MGYLIIPSGFPLNAIGKPIAWMGVTALHGSGNPWIPLQIAEGPNISPAGTVLGAAGGLSQGQVAQIPAGTINWAQSAPGSTVPAVPALTIPGGTFIATSGAIRPADPIYTRGVVLDTQLKNWGSCDVPFRLMFDFSPINSRSTNPVTGETLSKFAYSNLSSVINLMLADGTVNITNTLPATSSITYGNVGFTRTGVTRMLGASATFTSETGATLTTLGSLDDENLDARLTASGTSLNRIADVKKVLTGKWFRLKVSGTYHLKALEFTGEQGGLR